MLPFNQRFTTMIVFLYLEDYIASKSKKNNSGIKSRSTVSNDVPLTKKWPPKSQDFHHKFHEKFSKTDNQLHVQHQSC